MLTKIKWFIKGFSMSSSLMGLVVIVELVKENSSLRDELDEIKRPLYAKKAYSKTNCTKGKPVEKQNPKYPIGFGIPNVDISNGDVDDD